MVLQAVALVSARVYGLNAILRDFAISVVALFASAGFLERLTVYVPTLPAPPPASASSPIGLAAFTVLISEDATLDLGNTTYSVLNSTLALGLMTIANTLNSTTDIINSTFHISRNASIASDATLSPEETLSAVADPVARLILQHDYSVSELSIAVFHPASINPRLIFFILSIAVVIVSHMDSRNPSASFKLPGAARIFLLYNLLSLVDYGFSRLWLVFFPIILYAPSTTELCDWYSGTMTYLGLQELSLSVPTWIDGSWTFSWTLGFLSSVDCSSEAASMSLYAIAVVLCVLCDLCDKMSSRLHHRLTAQWRAVRELAATRDTLGNAIERVNTLNADYEKMRSVKKIQKHRIKAQEQELEQKRLVTDAVRIDLASLERRFSELLEHGQKTVDDLREELGDVKEHRTVLETALESQSARADEASLRYDNLLNEILLLRLSNSELQGTIRAAVVQGFVVSSGSCDMSLCDDGDIIRAPIILTRRQSSGTLVASSPTKISSVTMTNVRQPALPAVALVLARKPCIQCVGFFEQEIERLMIFARCEEQSYIRIVGERDSIIKVMEGGIKTMRDKIKCQDIDNVTRGQYTEGLSVALELARETIAVMKARVADLQETLHDRCKDLDRYRTDSTQLRLSNVNLRVENAALSTTKDILEEQIRGHEICISNLQQAIVRREQRQDVVLENRVQQLEAEAEDRKDQLKEQSESSRVQQRRLDEELKILKKHFSDLSSTKDSLTRKNKALSHDNASLEFRRCQAELFHAALKARVDTLEEQLKTAKASKQPSTSSIMASSSSRKSSQKVTTTEDDNSDWQSHVKLSVPASDNSSTGSSVDLEIMAAHARTYSDLLAEDIPELPGLPSDVSLPHTSSACSMDSASNIPAITETNNPHINGRSWLSLSPRAGSLYLSELLAASGPELPGMPSDYELSCNSDEDTSAQSNSGTSELESPSPSSSSAPSPHIGVLDTPPTLGFSLPPVTITIAHDSHQSSSNPAVRGLGDSDCQENGEGGVPGGILPSWSSFEAGIMGSGFTSSPAKEPCTSKDTLAPPTWKISQSSRSCQ
ncbi:hypothetical protein EWM64_g8401 [Hericium alpestre]|uniref:Uncharacterized protein n=1 Tax=Hericium alpestre TaxID=135208 RepID=A0A4Y9ZLG6_9AGAM|nr:hypothetical protein EWM64_g8401 [Hericium alpestre]